MDICELTVIESFFIDSTISSSSDENETEDEKHPVNGSDGGNNVNEKRPRVQFFIETVIYRYSEKEFQENCRMHRTTFDYTGRQPLRPRNQSIHFRRFLVR